MYKRQAAWATIQLLGEQGYAALARQARDGALALAAEVGGCLLYTSRCV